MQNDIFKTRCAGLILIATGYGWAGGHYIPANSSFSAYVFQFVVIAALLVMGIKFLSMSEDKGPKKNWATAGLGIFSIFSFLINILNIIHGAYTTDPNSFGSHNTFADLVPVSLLIAGSGIWVVTMFKKKESNN